MAVSRPAGHPSRDGTIPLIVCGNSPTAIRRAAWLGDGWHPVNLSPHDLTRGVTAYRAACGDAGRSPGRFIARHFPGADAPALEGRPLFTGSPPEIASDVERYADAGADELVVSWADAELDAILRRWQAFRNAVAR